MKIEHLCDHTAFSETVAKWLYDEFIVGIRKDVSYEYVLSSVNDCHKQKLPVRLIALLDGKCVGTVSIVVNDLKFRDYTPWLAALYVDPEHRSQGVGRRLVDAVKEAVRQLGYDKLYLRTEHAGDYYRALGWDYIETCKDEFGLNPDVFSFSLV